MTTLDIQGHLEEKPGGICGAGDQYGRRKEALGLWTGAGEGARFWLGVLTELRNRGVKDIYVVCVDGLRGFPQAIENAFLQRRCSGAWFT